MQNGEQSYGGFDRRTKGKGSPHLMSAYYEIAALLLQFENPWLRRPNNRSFFSSYNKQTEYRELLKLIQPISEIRAPDHFSISLILLPSPAFPHSEMSMLSVTSSHDPLPSLETKGDKGQCFSTCDSLIQEQYRSQNPSPSSFPSHLLSHSCVTCSPYSKACIHISEIKGSLPDT